MNIHTLRTQSRDNARTIPGQAQITERDDVSGKPVRNSGHDELSGKLPPSDGTFNCPVSGQPCACRWAVRCGESVRLAQRAMELGLRAYLGLLVFLTLVATAVTVKP